MRYDFNWLVERLFTTLNSLVFTTSKLVNDNIHMLLSRSFTEIKYASFFIYLEIALWLLLAPINLHIVIESVKFPFYRMSNVKYTT